MGQKNTFFEKQTGEVVEKKEKWPKNKPEQTGKQSGEVIENTCLWKKRTGTNLKTKLPILLKTLEGQKADSNMGRRYSGPFCSRSVGGLGGPACGNRVWALGKRFAWYRYLGKRKSPFFLVDAAKARYNSIVLDGSARQA
ncbi:MAG TPA: hypothetical protein VFQ24_12045 [Terriglobia bacterium]|nr:hypothetical protein [Terriglobia bacterium]